MKSSRLLILLLLILPSPAAAGALAVEADLGARVERFDWSIAAPGGSPDVLSELSWRDVTFAVLGGGFNYQPEPRLVLLGRAEYGVAFSGEVRDSDYLGSGRSDEFLRSVSRAAGSEQYTLTAALGLPLTHEANAWRLRLLPLLGIAYARQQLRLRDGVWVIPASGGRIKGLDSVYDANWFGPWVGLELGLENQAGYGLELRLERHFPRYEADAYWNLRDDPAAGSWCMKRFAQWADGRGSSAAFTGRYQAGPWQWHAAIAWSAWDTKPGTDRVYFCDGASAITGFNGAERESVSIAVGAGYRF